MADKKTHKGDFRFFPFIPLVIVVIAGSLVLPLVANFLVIWVGSTLLRAFRFWGQWFSFLLIGIVAGFIGVIQIDGWALTKGKILAVAVSLLAWLLGALCGWILTKPVQAHMAARGIRP